MPFHDAGIAIQGEPVSAGCERFKAAAALRMGLGCKYCHSPGWSPICARSCSFTGMYPLQVRWLPEGLAELAASAGCDASLRPRTSRFSARAPDLAASALLLEASAAEHIVVCKNCPKWEDVLLLPAAWECHSQASMHCIVEVTLS